MSASITWFDRGRANSAQEASNTGPSVSPATSSGSGRNRPCGWSRAAAATRMGSKLSRRNGVTPSSMATRSTSRRISPSSAGSPAQPRSS